MCYHWLVYSRSFSRVQAKLWCVSLDWNTHKASGLTRWKGVVVKVVMRMCRCMRFGTHVIDGAMPCVTPCLTKQVFRPLFSLFEIHPNIKSILWANLHVMKTRAYTCRRRHAYWVALLRWKTIPYWKAAERLAILGVFVFADVSVRSHCNCRILILLEKYMCTGSEYPRNSLFNFEREITSEVFFKIIIIFFLDTLIL